MRRLRAVVAGVLSPLLLAGFLIAIYPDPVSDKATLVLSSIVVAHTLFWPTAWVTNRIASRIGLVDTWHLALTMASVFGVLYLAVAVPVSLWDATFSWGALFREGASAAVASGAAYALYQALRPETSTVVGAAA